MSKCDLCDNPAVVHETLLKSGKQREVHLCADHARSAGISLPDGQPQPINQILTKFVISTATRRAKADRAVCDTCGLSFQDFRSSGIVGCPDCYEAFDRHLTPLIERAQNGGASHVGKSPRRSGAAIDRQLEIQRLVRELDSAVAAEQYERAAEIRDRLRSLESDVSVPRTAGGETGAGSA
jgi:protein arginine kinase activator